MRDYTQIQVRSLIFYAKQSPETESEGTFEKSPFLTVSRTKNCRISVWKGEVTFINKTYIFSGNVSLKGLKFMFIKG